MEEVRNLLKNDHYALDIFDKLMKGCTVARKQLEERRKEVGLPRGSISDDMHRRIPAVSWLHMWNSGSGYHLVGASIISGEDLYREDTAIQKDPLPCL